VATKTLEFEAETKKKEGEKKTVLSVPQQDILGDWQKDASLAVVGKGHSRLEGPAKVTGRAQYTHDVRLAGQLYGGVLRSPHAHARILSVDTSEAEALPGVHAVLALNDDLDIAWYEEETLLFSKTVRFIGDEVAAVAAKTEELVEDALRLIEVKYEPLAFVVDMTHALDDDAPKVHEDGNLIDEPDTYKRGNVEEGFKEAEVTVEASYSTQTALHNALEAHGTVAQWQGDELILYESTQGIFAVREEMANKLGLPQHKVRVIKEHMGGGFGAKQVPWKQTMFAALLAKRTGRPVQIMLDREGENLATGNRNPTRQQLRIGAKKDGTLTAIDLESLVTSGAYRVGGEGSDVGSLYQHLYKCENVKTKQTSVYTNLGPAVAFRAPGYAEACFALETAMDELAEKMSMDPLELRRKNYSERDQKQDLPWSSPDGLRSCYDRLEEAFDWKNYKKPEAKGSKRRGVGVAAHEWMAGSGNPPAYANVKLNSDGSAEVITGTQDIGTGSRTVLAQVAAETLGLPLESVRLQLGDTATGPYSPTSSGSFTVPTVGPAVRAAAADARKQLLEATATLLDTEVSDLSIEEGKVKGGKKVMSVSEIMERLAPHTIHGQGARHANPEGSSIRPFGAQAAEVEVDIETGEVTVLRVVSAPDCGRILNPKLARNQVIGGVTQGIGFALTEERVVDVNLGAVMNANLEDYSVPTVADVPPIEHAEVNLPDLNANPTGAKGLGELPLIPAAPAIVNAIYDATGVRLYDLPISRSRMVRALAEKDKDNA